MGSANHKTILLVEDEPTLQRILGSVLADAGHAVHTTATAEAALERLRKDEDVDLVLCDKNLPGMNGLELLEHARALERTQRRTLGFVLVTGYPSRDSAAAVLTHGGDGYLVKPFRSLSGALAEIERILADDLSVRRRAAAGAQALARALAGVASGSLPVTTAAILVDDPELARRIGATLAHAHVTVVDAAPPGVPSAAIALRADRLLSWAKDRGDISRVLCDVNAPFDDLVAVITRGGAALVDAALIGGS